MARKRERFHADYRKLELKILGRSALMFLLAVAFILIFYRLVLYQHFADFVVGLLAEFIFDGDWKSATAFYAYYIRSYMEVFFFLAIATMFIVILRFYLRSFTHYFNEINAGINSILDSEEDIRLSPELAATEGKINAIQRELRERGLATREAEQRKNDLVMYLAHDIRTPLTSVIGYLSLLEEAPDMPAEQRDRYVRITLDKAVRLEKMVDEFFEITRYNLQRIPLVRDTVDLEYMLCQVADELTPLLSANGNTVSIQVPDGLTVTGDPDKLARVFNNLLKNAAAYSDPDTEIHIAARRRGENVAIWFQNRGPTIPPEKLDALFERFYRMDGARATRTGGAGLGLAIAREIVSQHGGAIAAESASHQVRFTVTLPILMRV